MSGSDRWLGPESVEEVAVQGVVRHQPVDAAALVLHLAHQLAEAAVQLADEVVARDPDVSEDDLAEMLVAGHVLDRVHIDTR